MATPTQLTLYNGALRELGERQLASLSENREPRRLLDAVWDGAVKTCLEEADWKFAQRSSKLTSNPSYTAPFGYQYQMDRPSDCVRWSLVCTDEFFQVPLLTYVEEAGNIYTNSSEIYTGYVSDDANYGGNFSLWPESFTSVVEFYLASRIVKRIEQSSVSKAEIDKGLKAVLLNARSKDALRGPTKFLPQGSWVTARGGRNGTDRGSRGQLIG